MPEARREIGDPHFAAMAIGQLGANDRSIADVLRLEIRHVLEHYVGEPFFLLAGHQAAEDWVAIETRIAPPHDPRAWIDQRRGPAVADDGQIESMINHAAGLRRWTVLPGGRGLPLGRES